MRLYDYKRELSGIQRTFELSRVRYLGGHRDSVQLTRIAAERNMKLHRLDWELFVHLSEWIHRKFGQRRKFGKRLD